MVAVLSNMAKRERERNEADAIIHADIDIEELLEKLDFVDEDVVNAAKAQPTLFLTASRFRIQCMRLSTKAASKLETMRAEKSLAIRRKALSTAEKLTEGGISDKLRADEEVVKAQSACDKAKELEEFSKLVLDAYRMRRDALRIVSDLIGAEVFVQKHIAGDNELSNAKKRLKEKYKRREE
jgi:hypothetical protein